MKKIFANLKKILIAVIFLISCSEETILYNEIENSEGTIKTTSLPQTNNKLFQSFPSFSSNSKLEHKDLTDENSSLSFILTTLKRILKSIVSRLLADSI